MSSNKEKVSKGFIGWLVVASVLIVLIIVVAFAIFMNKEKNKGEEFFDSGSVVMTYNENSDIFFINNMLPLADEVAKANNQEGQYYDFTVKVNVGDASSVDYEVSLQINDEFTSALPETVKFYLEKQESGTYIPVFEPVTFDKLSSDSACGAVIGSKIIVKSSSKEDVSHNYRLRMWLSEGTVVSPEVLQTFGVEIKVHGKTRD